jgi:hypothetical protein
LYKSLIALYFVCFGCYLLFSRQPDYLDGEKAPAVIHWLNDSASGRSIPQAVFNTGLKNYAIDARYIFREWEEGDKVNVIYETAGPGKAAVYLIWGYWLKWEELIASAVLSLVLFQLSVNITKNPSPESLIEQLEVKTVEKKRRYKE